MFLKYRSNRRNIGVVIDRFEHRYQYVFCETLTSLAKERDVNLIFFSGFNLKSPYVGEDQFNLVYELINVNYLDGVIVSTGSLSCSITYDEIAAFCDRFSSIPLVSMGLELAGYPSVVVDNKGGMKEAVLHLIEKHGVKKVGFIKGPDGQQEADCRYQGYLEALEEKKLPLNPALIFQGNFNFILDEDKLIKALQAGELDSIAVANDQMSTEAVRIINKTGLRVPDDIRLVSFDNLVTSAYNDPPLSSVNQPVEELAEQSLDTLFQMFEKKSPERLKILKTGLIKRNSCGCSDGSLNDFYEHTTKDFIQVKSKFSTLRSYYKSMDKIVLQWRYFSMEMNSVVDYADMIANLPPHLTSMGITQLYLCLFQWEVNYPDHYIPKYSNLIMAMDERGLFLDEKNSVTFITEKLLPEGILNEDKQFSFLVQPLVRMGTHYGYIIFGITHLEAMVYGIVREQICNTIHTIRMIKERSETLDRLKFALEDQKINKERLEEMVTNLPSILMETDVDLTITYLNHAGSELLSLPKDRSLTNVRLQDFVYPADKAKFEESCKSLLQKTASRLIEFRILDNKNIVVLIGMAVPIIREKKRMGIRFSVINLNTLLKFDGDQNEALIENYHLSIREKEVLKYLIMGEKYKEIGEKLFIAESTVKDHVKSIYNKMGVENKQEFYSQFKNLLNNENEQESLAFILLRFFMND